MRRASAFLLLAICAVLCRPLLAHPLDPALLELTERGDGRVDVLWRVPANAPRNAPLRPILPEACRQLDPAQVTEGAQRISLAWQVDCGGPLSGSTLRIEGLDARGTDALVRIAGSDGSSFQAVLRPGDSELLIPAELGVWTIGADYLKLGFEHLLGGYDHLLFVLGLLFLVRGWRALLWTVTAFTVGHSITLSAATLGWVSVPSALTEAAIALSIFVLALQLAGPEHSRPRRPWLMAAGFGLLHGLGFAGALTEAGLPAREVPLALFAFNLGIELGQLAFVGVVLGMVALVERFRRERWQVPLSPAGNAGALRAWALPAAYVIGSLSFSWVIQRSLVLW
ncbi:MAG: HupE/UreJ family protein [Acidobacteriota bacterium]